LDSYLLDLLQRGLHSGRDQTSQLEHGLCNLRNDGSAYNGATAYLELRFPSQLGDFSAKPAVEIPQHNQRHPSFLCVLLPRPQHLRQHDRPSLELRSARHRIPI